MLTFTTELSDQWYVLSAIYGHTAFWSAKPIRAKEGLDCVRRTSRQTPGTQSHRTQGHRCQDLGKELQSCCCCSGRNLEQTNDKEFQSPLPLHPIGVTVEEKEKSFLALACLCLKYNFSCVSHVYSPSNVFRLLMQQPEETCKI